MKYSSNEYFTKIHLELILNPQENLAIDQEVWESQHSHPAGRVGESTYAYSIQVIYVCITTSNIKVNEVADF